jgi:hypothetical protein
MVRSIGHLLSRVRNRCRFGPRADLPPASMIGELTKPRVVPAELFKDCRRLPPEEARVNLILEDAAWHLWDNRCPRNGILNAFILHREDSTGLRGLTPRQAIDEARLYLIGIAAWRRGSAFLATVAKFRHKQACYIHWECSSDSEVIRYSFMGRWAFRVRNRLLPLLGWEEIPCSPKTTDQKTRQDDLPDESS